MKKRHNKKRNTAFIYEALIREMSKAVINRDDSLRSNILSLVKENFNKSSVLGKELSCYKLLDENLGVDKYTAEKSIFRTKKEYDSLDKDHIFEAQSKVIKSINQDIGKSVFSKFIPDEEFNKFFKLIFKSIFIIRVSQYFLVALKIFFHYLKKQLIEKSCY